MGRDVISIYPKIDSNVTTKLTYYGPSAYTKSPLFLITLFLANGFRDFILVIIDIVLNIYLAVKLRQFFKKKKEITDKSLTTKRQSEPVKTKFKLTKSEIKNTITTFVMSAFSILQHLVTFMV